MMRVAVIGATGFIGSAIVDSLLSEEEVEVTAGVRTPAKAEALRARGVQIERVDLSRAEVLDGALAGQDVVINTAHDFHASAAENIQGFEALVDACLRQGVRCIVHLSSIVVYDAWPSGTIDESSARSLEGHAYRRAKVSMERLLEDKAARTEIGSRILQPTIVYGPDGWIWTESILERLESGTVVLPEDCDGHCHAVFVDDVARAAVRAARIGTADEAARCERYVVTGPEPITWRRFFEGYARLVPDAKLRFEPMPSLASVPVATEEGAPLGLRAGVGRLLSGLRRSLGEARFETAPRDHPPRAAVAWTHSLLAATR